MKKIIFWYFQGSKILKLGTTNVFWDPKLDFLGKEHVNWNWGPIFVFDEKYNFFGTSKGQKSKKWGTPKLFWAPIIFWPPKVGIFGPGGHKIWRSNFCFFHFLKNFIISFFFKIPLKCLFEYGPSYSHPSWSNVKENKMSRMKGQCVPTFFDGGLLRKFFSFWGAHKTFFWPSKPYLALETPTLGGGSYF